MWVPVALNSSGGLWVPVAVCGVGLEKALSGVGVRGRASWVVEIAKKYLVSLCFARDRGARTRTD